MTEWIEHIIQTIGYGGITFLAFLETVFPPIPSEIVMTLAGYSTTQGDMSFAGVIVAGIIGFLGGAVILYFLGVWVSEERVKRWADQYGAWLTVTSDEIDNAKGSLYDHGGKIIVAVHILPGIRSLISIPAGIIRLPLWKFVVYSALGKGLWITFLAFVGRALGENYQLVQRYSNIATGIVIVVIAVIVGVWVWRRKRMAEAN